MLLNRHRIAKLIELADLERRLTGPERTLREEDVAILIKAAYDDATDAARAAFMARVQAMPVTAWPWSAVQAKAARGGGGVGGVVVGGPGGGMTLGFAPTPMAVIPPALLLIRGEAESADAEPGNRLPERGSPEAAAWEPLHKALDRWDTRAVAGWIGPQGWISPSGATAPNTDDGATSGPPAGGMGGSPGGGGSMPPTQPPAWSTFSWRNPAVIAVGTTVASTVGVVLFSLRRRRASVAPQQEAP